MRKLEFLISMLVFVMAACFFGELSIVKPPAKEVMKGLFIPRLNGDGATADAIALLGALVMPYAFTYIHTYATINQLIHTTNQLINYCMHLYICSHNLFLHSALVLSRKTPASVRGIKVAIFSLGRSR